MPRPEHHMITFPIDGREVQAPENMMLVDAAKLGDVEIPVFCYEPKLGQPVGACRMCLVEIEGIPKLQTACSTAVKDGMVVHTQSERARDAQQAVVEFLLVNHPLDCPVCDKGGECPLQDITFGWGGGRSRFIEPKRHFHKPLELSPLIAIDRERCILCYRCVRFSQEISEDYQLILLERGAHSFVGTFDGHPYVAPFSGNIIELCPVGALTSRPYRFRARPWDIEGAGTLCTLCPAQCNVDADRPRRARPARARPRARRGRRRLAVRQGPLRLPGDPRRRAHHRADDPRRRRAARRSAGSARSTRPPAALRRAGARVARARRRRRDQRGGASCSARLLRDGLGSPHLDSRPRRRGRARRLARAARARRCRRRVSDLEFAHAVLVLDCEPLDDAPILELRIRKGVRRNGVKLAVATDRPSALDPSAARRCASPPAAAPSSRRARRRAARRGRGRAAAAAAPTSSRGARATLRDGGEEVVILYGERLLDGGAARRCSRSPTRSGSPRATAPGCSASPTRANGRGLREAGVLPERRPGLADAPPAGGLDAAGDRRGAARAASSTALYLLGVDPLRDLPDRAAWERRARARDARWSRTPRS